MVEKHVCWSQKRKKIYHVFVFDISMIFQIKLEVSGIISFCNINAQYWDQEFLSPISGGMRMRITKFFHTPF